MCSSRSRGLVLIGDGGHARVVAEAYLPQRVAGHVSPAPGSDQASIGTWLGTDSDVRRLCIEGYEVALGIGFVDRPGAIRRSLLLGALANLSLVTIQHKSAVVASSARIDAGCFVGAGAIIGPGAAVGTGSIVNSGAVIDHDCVIGVNVHVGPNVSMSGGVKVGDHSLVGVGSTVRQHVSIGPNVVIGAGSVVVADVPAGVTVVGVPARRSEAVT